MPDLDQLFDTLVADVAESTRAPGAPRAIRQARRGRAAVVSAVVAAVVVTGALGAMVAGGNDRTAPAGGPTPTSSPRPISPPDPTHSFPRGVQQALALAPEWTVAEGDTLLMSPCAGDWSRAATGGNGGSVDTSASTDRLSAWASNVGFRSPALAAAGVTLLLDNLASCEARAWRTAPVPGTGAVLASSSSGVAWIHRHGSDVATLEIPTADGPPPLDVQVAVARLIRSGAG